MALSTTRKRVFVGLLVAVTAVGSFGYGLIVSEFEVWPYRALQPVWGRALELVYRRSAAPGSALEAEDLVRTNLLNLSRSTYLASRGGSGCCHGGGIAREGGTIIVVDAFARFYRYTPGGNLDPLDIRLETRQEAFSAFADDGFEDRTFRTRALRNFRVLDLMIGRDGESGRFLAVSYHYWHGDRLERTTRVARLQAESLFSDPLGFTEGGDGWEILFESSPGLGPDDPLDSNATGGRMVLDRDGSIVLGVGENGLHLQEGGPQSESGSYGKLIRIERDGTSSIMATGIRNPQGLVIDSEGRIWETEHGPRGGDELNMIASGENYGWPHVTLGTDYNELTWSYGTAGRHDGYRWPVYSWVPSIAVSSLIQAGDQPAQWAGDLLVASLRSRSLHRLKVVEGRVVIDEHIPIGHRIRDLMQTADGVILLYTDDGKMIELQALAEPETPVERQAQSTGTP